MKAKRAAHRAALLYIGVEPTWTALQAVFIYTNQRLSTNHADDTPIAASHPTRLFATLTSRFRCWSFSAPSIASRGFFNHTYVVAQSGKSQQRQGEKRACGMVPVWSQAESVRLCSI